MATTAGSAAPPLGRSCWKSSTCVLSAPASGWLSCPTASAPTSRPGTASSPTCSATTASSSTTSSAPAASILTTSTSAATPPSTPTSTTSSPSSTPSALTPASSSAGKEESVGVGVRLQQWSPEETRELIRIRGELEQDFTAAKRNKSLWDLVAARMLQRGGYRRSPDQCNCKWKNLVNRYRGKETFDPENGKQCPFFEELHAVFTERARNMQRKLCESESGVSYSKKKLKRIRGDKSFEEVSLDEDEDDEDSINDHRKRKADRQPQQHQHLRPADKSRVTINTSAIHDLLHDFLQQQQRKEVNWQEMMERRAQERLLFEQEWRQSMEQLERERMMLEKAWREKDEQRRITEEARAEKREKLLTTLLNRLLQEESL